MRTINILLFCVILSFPVYLKAQVTVGSGAIPEKAALLDIKTITGSNGQISSDAGGLLLPRVTISDVSVLGVFANVSGIDTPQEKLMHKGLTVYNIGSINVEPGIYVWDSVKWQKAGVKKEVNFFYMPSIQIDLSQTSQTINLYTRYKAQFENPKASSTGTLIPFYPNSTDLDYYITDYDLEVFDTVTVDTNGNMNYTLKSPLPADVCCSHINIVFVVR